MSPPSTPGSSAVHNAAPSAAELIPDLGLRRGAAQAGHALAVQRMFDRVSPTYDLLNRLMSFGIDQRWRRHALSALRRDLPPGPLLDLCAGTGDFAQALGVCEPDRALVAADFSREMLVAGRGKTRRTGHMAPGGLAQADAMTLPLADGAFAGAVCGFGIRNLADPRACLREVYRVLQPGGVFVVLEFYRPTRPFPHAFHALYGRLLLPAMGALVSGELSAYRYLSRSMVGFMSRDEFELAMAEAGFQAVSGRDLTFGVASLIRGEK